MAPYLCDVGSSSQTVIQHLIGIGSTCIVKWAIVPPKTHSHFLHAYDIQFILNVIAGDANFFLTWHKKYEPW